MSDYIWVNGKPVSDTNALPVKPISQSTYKTTALVASGVIKASPGVLNNLSGYNDSASAQYIQVFNSAAVPVDTTIPVVVIYVAAKTNFSIDFGFYGLSFDTGISWSNSSTLATKTIGSADCWTVASYK